MTSLLTDNPAIYLQPALKNEIDLRRLTRIYQWLDPAMNENSVFELLRESMFEFKLKSDKWIQALPPNIWDPKINLPAKDGVRAGLLGVQKWLENTIADAPEGIRPVAQGVQGQLEYLSNNLEDHHSKVHRHLLQAMGEMEMMIETYHRFTSYQDEIQGIRESGLSFREWSSLRPREALPEDQDAIVCLIPKRFVATDQRV